MRRLSNIGLLLAHRLRRWPNSKPALAQRLMFAWRSDIQSILTPVQITEYIIFDTVITV